MGQFMKFDDMSETSLTAPGAIPVPELPRLHEKVSSTMFFFAELMGVCKGGLDALCVCCEVLLLVETWVTFLFVYML